MLRNLRMPTHLTELWYKVMKERQSKVKPFVPAQSITFNKYSGFLFLLALLCLFWKLLLGFGLWSSWEKWKVSISSCALTFLAASGFWNLTKPSLSCSFWEQQTSFSSEVEVWNGGRQCCRVRLIRGRFKQRSNPSRGPAEVAKLRDLPQQ